MKMHGKHSMKYILDIAMYAQMMVNMDDRNM
jgi:hypothetical protein